jgi:release factor-specific protein-(glutamine-N5) methyltransferase
MTPQAMTLQEAYAHARGLLESWGSDSPHADAQLLLGGMFNLNASDLVIQSQRVLGTGEVEALNAALGRRRHGEPLQYIIGKAAFRHIELAVRPGVLIPRPETELLVDFAISHIRSRQASGATEPCKLLDLCTGSGCVALSVILECDGVKVTATDIDAAAVELAKFNARRLGCEGSRLRIIHDDLASSLLCDDSHLGCYDALLANPPYVPTGLLPGLPREVLDFEPSLALDGGLDGLAVFRRIERQGRQLLREGGMLVCELYDEGALESAADICEADEWREVRMLPDLTGRMRFIKALRGPR